MCVAGDEHGPRASTICRQTCGKFYVSAHVVSILPEDRRLLCQPYCRQCCQVFPSHPKATQCPHCPVATENVDRNLVHAGPAATFGHIYMGLFCVADELAELAVIVVDEDGQQLLPGLAATDLKTSTATLAALEERLHRMLDVGGGRTAPQLHWPVAHSRFKTAAERDAWLAQPQPPRVDLCIKLYTIASPSGPQRRYRLFNCILV